MTDMLVHEVSAPPRVTKGRKWGPGHPENLTIPELDRLFRDHPELRGIKAAALVDSLYDAVVMNA